MRGIETALESLRRLGASLALVLALPAGGAPDCSPAPPAAPGPAAGAAAAPSPSVVRGPCARDALRLSWEYPVYTPPSAAAPGRRATPRSPRAALAAEEAFAYLAGDDPRPLLVLRECFVCIGTDDALLPRGADNEKTLLYSRWFHCVKLPADVLEHDHPFRNLFPGGKTEHLFLATRDGSLRLALESQRPRTELWGAMARVLGAAYEGDPARSVEQLQGLLGELDAVDRQIADLQTRSEEWTETDGPPARKQERVRKQLDEAREAREALLVQLTRAATLELRSSAADESAEGHAG